VDDEIRRPLSFKFLDKAKARRQARFFLWLNPNAAMHIVHPTSRPKYEALRNSKNGWSIHEAGHGAARRRTSGLVMQKLKDMGRRRQQPSWCSPPTNGTEVFYLGRTADRPRFCAKQGHDPGRRFSARPRHDPPGPARWPAGKVEETASSPGSTGFPTFPRRPPETRTIAEELKKGKQIGGPQATRSISTAYNQMDMITGKGAVEPARNLLFRRKRAWRRAPSTTFKYRFIDQPGGAGWAKKKKPSSTVPTPDQPAPRSPSSARAGPIAGTKFRGAAILRLGSKYEFWRFVFVQQQVEKNWP